MPEKEEVILIHGLWMKGLVFIPHQRRLEARGFSVQRFSYPSWHRDLDWNSRQLAELIADSPAQTIHLLGHSLGGLVALTMLEKWPDRRIRRAVFMGTPYAGCHSGRYMAARWPLSGLLGRSMKDWLACAPPGAPEFLELGTLAGTRRLGLGCVIPGLILPNDGVVTVAETCIPGARDTITLPVSHSGMIFSKDCTEQAVHFFETGSFIHG